MALKISDLIGKQKTATLDLGDGLELELRYNPHDFTKEFYKSISDQTEEDSMFDAIVKYVKGWSLVDDNEKEVPITVDFLKTLSMSLVMRIWTGVLKDSQDFDPKLK